MHLTDRTDFSLRVLLYLAANGNTRVSVRTMAQSFAVSEAHLAKCVQALAQGNFVATVPGRRGGVSLARPADEIAIGAVVRALEPMALVECMGPDNTCLLTPACGFLPVLTRAKAAFLRELDAVSIGEAARDRAGIRKALVDGG